MNDNELSSESKLPHDDWTLAPWSIEDLADFESALFEHSNLDRRPTPQAGALLVCVYARTGTTVAKPYSIFDYPQRIEIINQSSQRYLRGPLTKDYALEKLPAFGLDLFEAISKRDEGTAAREEMLGQIDFITTLFIYSTWGDQAVGGIGAFQRVGMLCPDPGCLKPRMPALFVPR